MEPLIDKNTKRWISLMNFGAKMGCHQMPDRSFSYKGYQFPVCARCTGVIIGEFISIIAILCALKISWLYIVFMIVPLSIDGGLQYINVWKSNNVRRIITGILAGFGLTYVYYYIFDLILHVLLSFFANT